MLFSVVSVILYFHEWTIEEKALLYMQKWCIDPVFFYTKESLLFIPSESETVSEGPVFNFIDIILEFSKV